MKVEAYLYDADGSDREIDLNEDSLAALTDKQLLWVNVLERESSALELVASILKLKNLPTNNILRISERPKLDKFENFYRFFIVSVQYDENNNLSLIPIDFIVGRNYVITVHNGRVDYYSEFIKGEKGETQIGEMDAESFVVSLLDLHIVTYFRVLEKIENRIDKMDERILKRDLEDEEFLAEIIKLRSDVSRLRRWLLPHRDVFYALSRPDFKTVTTDAESLATFQLLNEHFETCATAIESSRESVLSLFNLYATKTTHRMNFLIRRLTFITLVVGALGAIAGIWGMNFEVEYFKYAENGFWLTIAAMISLTLGLTILARWKRWI